jgi:hypothetical protein
MRCRPLVVVLLVLAACEEPATPPPGVSGERLLASPPPGWVRTFQLDEGAMRLVEFMPEAVEGDAWIDKVSFESFTGDELPDPIVFQDAIVRDRKQACSRLDDFNTFTGFENNYPTSVRLLLCHRHKTASQGEITMLKTIQGNEAFYVVQRARRVEPFDSEVTAPMRNEEMGLWSLYFRTITVCDDGRPEHPCPAPADQPE